ncbi:hypothetical protein [Phormidium sp. CCY1219]|uniref:hypothetical protein n=1 Tax=Phormidium sp. CCY1219 TaxID=2886104 RepID=UPI002D1EEA10|nr:hypothetical protein [Phormidium sp. CCY1219]MEB3828884.1 hypothetical protein [Phormidium sp. CCY1219]
MNHYSDSNSAIAPWGFLVTAQTEISRPGHSLAQSTARSHSFFWLMIQTHAIRYSA